MKLPKFIRQNWFFINRVPISLLSIAIIAILGVVDILLKLISLI